MKKVFSIIILLLLVFYSLGLIHQTNLATQDIGRHIKSGQIVWQEKIIPQTNFFSYTYPDSPFINHHWLSGLILYFLFILIGFKGLIILKTIILLITFLIVFLISSKKGNFWLAVFFSIPVIFLLCERTEVRPEIFSFLLIAIFLYSLLYYSSSRKIFWLVPLQFLWTNLHIYFPIGFLMTAGFLFEQIIFKRKKIFKDKTIRRLFLLLILLILVCLINPAGIKGAVYPFRIFKGYGYQIVENQSPFFLENMMHNPSVVFFKIIVPLLLLSFLLNLKKFSPFLFLASLSVCILGCQMIRGLPLIGLIALPVLSINSKPWFEKRIKSNNLILSSFFIPFLIILNLLSFKGIVKLNDKPKGLGLTFQTADSAEFFKKENISGPIFNSYDNGSYLIFYLYPQEKVFADNRPEAYPRFFFEDIYREMQLNEEKWQTLSQEYGINAIYFPSNEATPWGTEFVQKRIGDPDWALVYADSQNIIFLKRNEINKAIIDKYLINAENIEKRIESIINSEELKVNLTGVKLVNLLGKNDSAIKLTEELLKKYPKQGQIYLELASLELEKANTNSYLTAKRYLEKAIQLGEDFPSVYNQLGLINFSLNLFSEAKESWQKALKIDKDNEHAKYYLKQYEELELPE